MKNGKIRKRFYILLIVIIVVNTLLSIIWIGFKTIPHLKEASSTRDKITSENIYDSYDSIEILKKEMSLIEKQYDIKIIISNSSKEIISNNEKEDEDLFYFYDVVNVDDDIYMINAYICLDISFGIELVKLIVFQLIVLSVILFFASLFINSRLILPIEKIINDIRNYKLGKKPKKVVLNDEFDLIQNEFVNLVESLEDEKNKQKRIIASISHDIKTPLTSIIGYSDLINDSNITKDEIKKYNSKIYDKAIHIKDILGTFDDYLINYDNNKLNLTNIKIKDLIKDINDDYKLELENKKIDFEIITDVEEDIIVVDFLKIKRIFSNVISNSIRYIKNNGKITINIEKDNKYYIFKIADNGKRVSDDVLSKIFEPFFTTDESRKISGLGLSICREFVIMHGGTIKAYNNKKGLTICFNIPIDRK